MILEPASTQAVDSPSDADIAAAIRDEANEFVILGAGKRGNVYIQTSGNIVEYRETDPATGQWRQWQSSTDQPTEKIIELFCAYNRGDPSYKTAIEWQETGTGSNKKGCTGMIVLAALGAAALGAGIWRIC